MGSSNFEVCLVSSHLELTRVIVSRHLRQCVSYANHFPIWALSCAAVHFPFEQNEIVKDQLYDEEFVNITFKKNFDDIGTVGEIWQWVEVRNTNRDFLG